MVSRLMRLVTPVPGRTESVDQPLLQMFDLILLCLIPEFVAPGVLVESG